jgi:hypothetical protein
MGRYHQKPAGLGLRSAGFFVFAGKMFDFRPASRHSKGRFPGGGLDDRAAAFSCPFHWDQGRAPKAISRRLIWVFNGNSESIRGGKRLMKMTTRRNSSFSGRSLEVRLAGYLAAAGATVAATSSANAAIVANTTLQPFGVNGVVPIDFNSDGQTDFQIDHDRVTLPGGGPTLDYLQVDKNDINGESNPLAFDPGPGSSFQATPFSDGATTRNDANNAAYAITGPLGSYPAALTAGTLIGPSPLSTFDWQETDNFQSSGKWLRANRLIDEDQTQIDQVLGGRPASGVQVPTNGPNFTGLGGAVRYLGLQMELNNSGGFNYGWVGLKIDNEADATGAVVGYGYQTIAGVPIRAGAVPEPQSLLMGVAGIAALVGARLRRRKRQALA